MQLQHTSFEACSKPSSMSHVPLLIDDSKANRLIGRSGFKDDEDRFIVTLLPDDAVRRRLGFVNEVRVEDVCGRRMCEKLLRESKGEQNSV